MSQREHLSCVEHGTHNHCPAQICMKCGHRFPCAGRRAEDAESAIQRVREVCDDKYVGPPTEYGEGFQNGYNDALEQVRRSLDGTE